jgi:hypothetical protein
MADLTLAEELLLVALDDEKGADTANWGSGVEAGLAGALLLDLAAAGCLTHEAGRLVPTSCEAPADPLAAAALDAIRSDDRRRDAKAWIGRIPKALKPLRARVAERLVERGILEKRRRRRLGLFETTRFPARDPQPERRLRAALNDVLVTGREPTPQEAMLIALLSAYDLVKRVVPRDDRRAAGKRAKQIAEGDVIGDAVARTVRDVQGATIAAVTAATSAAVIPSGGS